MVTWLSLMKSAEVPGSRDSPNCLSGNWGWIGSGILTRDGVGEALEIAPLKPKEGLNGAPRR